MKDKVREYIETALDDYSRAIGASVGFRHGALSELQILSMVLGFNDLSDRASTLLKNLYKEYE